MCVVPASSPLQISGDISTNLWYNLAMVLEALNRFLDDIDDRTDDWRITRLLRAADEGVYKWSRRKRIERDQKRLDGFLNDFEGSDDDRLALALYVGASEACRHLNGKWTWDAASGCRPAEAALDMSRNLKVRMGNLAGEIGNESLQAAIRDYRKI